MNRLPLFLISHIFLCAFGCGSKHCSVETGPLAQYRDTIIENFDGKVIDTFIAEPIDTSIDSFLWNYPFYMADS